MKKIVAAMAAALVLAMTLLVGCGEEAPETLAGTTWEATSVENNGKTYDVATLLAANGLSDGSITIQFDENKAIAEVVGTESEKDYTYEDGVLTIEGQTITVNGTTFELSMDGMTMTMTLQESD